VRTGAAPEFGVTAAELDLFSGGCAAGGWLPRSAGVVVARVPGGGASGCVSIAAPGRCDGGRLIGAGNGRGGGCDREGGAPGTSAGGRGGELPKIESNWASAGPPTAAPISAAAKMINRRLVMNRLCENRGIAPRRPG
jgi:hypothetical protein